MYKDRAVYQRNIVRDQDGKCATFQELASCPSAMSASKVADVHSLLEGHYGEQVDCEMVYTQRDMQ